MADTAITKTAWGYIPFSQVKRIEDAGTGDRFRFFAPDATSEPADDSREAQVSLVDLGTCVVPTEDGLRPDAGFMLDFARKSGPLFGNSGVDISTFDDESTRDWSYATFAAMLATRIQECANGRKPVATLRSIGQPMKQVITFGQGNREILLYAVVMRVTGEYAARFRGIDLLARLAQKEWRYLYTFITNEQAGVTPNDGILSFMVVSVQSPLAMVEFSYLCQVMQIDVQAEEAFKSQLGGQGAFLPDARGADELIMTGEQLETRDAELDEGDLPALAALVQAMILAHINDARVDVFRGESRTGYLTFDSFISWLWYQFSHELGNSVIGYCNYCGKPFSLVGHRGMDRLYCSRACKTSAKNDKTRKEREKCRSLFMAGHSVDEIAQRVYGDADADKERVKDLLSKWVELKHKLDDSIEEQGFARSELFKRCRDEDLDMERLLSVKRIKQLRDLFKKSTPSK